PQRRRAAARRLLAHPPIAFPRSSPRAPPALPYHAARANLRPLSLHDALPIWRTAPPARSIVNLRRPSSRPATKFSTAVIAGLEEDRKSTRLNSSHVAISYAVFCLKKKTPTSRQPPGRERATARSPARPRPGRR